MQGRKGGRTSKRTRGRIDEQSHDRTNEGTEQDKRARYRKQIHDKTYEQTNMWTDRRTNSRSDKRTGRARQTSGIVNRFMISGSEPSHHLSSCNHNVRPSLPGEYRSTFTTNSSIKGHSKGMQKSRWSFLNPHE